MKEIGPKAARKLKYCTLITITEKVHTERKDTRAIQMHVQGGQVGNGESSQRVVMIAIV